MPETVWQWLRAANKAARQAKAEKPEVISVPAPTLDERLFIHLAEPACMMICGQCLPSLLHSDGVMQAASSTSHPAMVYVQSPANSVLNHRPSAASFTYERPFAISKCLHAPHCS